MLSKTLRLNFCYSKIIHILTHIRGGSRAAATSTMECFVIIVDGFQPYYTINDNKNEDENQIKIT